MKHFKGTLVFVTAMAMTAALTGCMRNGNDTPSATAEPTNMVENAGQAQIAPAAFDWQTRVGEVENTIAQLSEISEDRVLVMDNTALVGVRFSPEYRGEMTERIHDMVASVIMQVDPQVTTVAVTAAEEDVGQIFDMADRIAGGANADDMKEDMQKIVRNAATLR